jgi:ABC-type sugar transport system permease subunit
MSIRSKLEQRSGFIESLPSIHGDSRDTFETALTLPSLLYVLLLAGFPVLFLLYVSMSRDLLSIVESPQFVWLKNYIVILTSPEFWGYFGNTIFFASVTVLGGMVLQLGIALMLNTDLPYRRVWQTLILLPWAVPHVITAQIWKLLFNPTFGAINWFLLETGLIEARIHWFAGKWVAFSTIIITDIWIRTPLVVLILLAGLETIPDEYYEAARMDGAGVWDRFVHITLPQLRSALIVALVIRLILALRAFELIYAMTLGGPGNATTVVALDIWERLIQYGSAGLAAAESVILVLVIYGLIAVAVYAFSSVEAEDVG